MGTIKGKKYRRYMLHVQMEKDLCLDIESYLEGVISSEMSPAFEMEALKAQCVAARTFVVQRGYEVDDTTNTQVYRDDKQLKDIWKDNYDVYHKKIQQAVQETTGEILTYQGKPISALFLAVLVEKQRMHRNIGGIKCLILLVLILPG